MSVKAYDRNHMLAAAEAGGGGNELGVVVGKMSSDPKASYVNVHNAEPGCSAFRVERA